MGDAPDDPVAAQYVPRAAELITTPDERSDPIGDDAHSPLPGITHRYPDRVLLKPLHVCPVYCRFCFRREVVGPTGGLLGDDELAAALDYIRARPAIWEVILTGGDPFALSPRRLAALTEAVTSIDHVQVLRVHTRVPVAAPSKVTDALVAALKAPKAVFAVVHVNHPRELTPEADAALAKLVDAGIPVLSQSVLLAGVNDDAATLEALFRGLVARRVKPYYLHHPDLAPGTSRFRVDLNRGREITGELGAMSGLCRPTYVLDIPGGHGKVSAAPERVTGPDERGKYTAVDPTGRAHTYPPDKG